MLDDIDVIKFQQDQYHPIVLPTFVPYLPNKVKTQNVQISNTNS